ncbi:exopolysaccharide Pel transporter PelG [Pleionea mediterranea]|uniref:Putative membrane protein n=1 Tax=Pleionea mediterranea TaxID=523701 RepID=A0A316FK88_9GAMM|nr:exopolysaccharide Pel transporter PelG [Pleionea mediterranea]PWK49318.1 putative membrane protein [Pleionea mediterranea]
MAGIGFEIRKILKKDSFLSLLQAYGFAGLISSGPWVLSIVAVMLIGIFSFSLMTNTTLIVQFLVSVTYLMAASLIVTGFLQLMFTRFVADRLFENKSNIILPNLLGALTITTLVVSTLSIILSFLFINQSIEYILLMFCNFVVLSNLWIVLIFLSSMKAYIKILVFFFIGYGIAVAAALLMTDFGIEGLLSGILLGHAFLLCSFLFIIIREYPGIKLVSFDFLKNKNIFISLAFTGLFFNAGVWIDKIVFWFHPDTSDAIIGPLRASVIYDFPIFLAYLSIIPGMAVFLVRMETDFAEQYDLFYNSVREGDTLQNIQYRKSQMIYTARQGIYEIFKVQGITVVLLLLWGKDILNAFGISSLYAPLLYIDIVGVGMQVLFLSILNVLFYLDDRKTSLILCLMFFLLNGTLSLISIDLGASFFGYGFALSTSLVSILGIYLLSRLLENLEYRTFMLHRT